MGTNTPPAFDEHCIVELLGHRRLAARVTEVTIAGAGMLRLDEPATERTPARTQYVSPSAVYALHPVTEDVVQAMAARWHTEPVSRYELPRAPEPNPDPDEESFDCETCGGPCRDEGPLDEDDDEPAF